MRRIVAFIFTIVLLMSMSCNRGPQPADIAAKAAKDYYDKLIGGKYEEFVHGMNMPYAIPDSYREQLVTNAKMFIGQQKEEHRGLREVRIVNAVADTTKHSANVFLVFCYGDSTNNEVVVPMVERKGVWYMR
jgi:hypothetical protein